MSGRALVGALVLGLAVACAAPPPHESTVPKGAVAPIDGLWRMAENGVIYQIDQGRVFAPQGVLLIALPGAVVVKDVRQTGPKNYEGWDIFHAGPWQASVMDDGTIVTNVGGALPATYHLSPVAIDDPAWFDAQMAANVVLPQPRRAVADSDTPPMPAGAFGRYYALVIGNNAYQHLTPLRTARSDANAVSELLRGRYGFEVETLLDANREDILVALSRYRKKLLPEDNLLIYYAGHGWLDEAADEGYWLPVDATPDNDVRWISNATITAHFRAFQAKHVLVVADSCFSGTLTRGIKMAPNTPNDLERMSQRKARIVLSSGGEEPVSDGTGDYSAFATVFIAALEENDAVLDTTSLYAKIRRPVMLASDQDPDLADIRKAGHDGGDFLFVPTDTAP